MFTINKKLKQIKNINDLAEFMVGAEYREIEVDNITELHNQLETKIKELWQKFGESYDLDEDENDDWIDFWGDEITFYRAIPKNSEGVDMESIEDKNIGFCWVANKEQLNNIPWYDEDDSTVVEVTVKTDSHDFIAYNNYIDIIIEVLLPNVCDKYNVKYTQKRQ